MVTSIILINAERDKVAEVAQHLAGIDGITEAYSVSGQYDIIAIARVPAAEDLALLVTQRLQSIHAITRTETLLAFKAYSRHDLESMFDVGV